VIAVNGVHHPKISLSLCESHAGYGCTKQCSCLNVTAKLKETKAI
jgi:hypothetical protein